MQLCCRNYYYPATGQVPVEKLKASPDDVDGKSVQVVIVQAPRGRRKCQSIPGGAFNVNYKGVKVYKMYYFTNAPPTIIVNVTFVAFLMV